MCHRSKPQAWNPNRDCSVYIGHRSFVWRILGFAYAADSKTRILRESKIEILVQMSHSVLCHVRGCTCVSNSLLRGGMWEHDIHQERNKLKKETRGYGTSRIYSRESKPTRSYRQFDSRAAEVDKIDLPFATRTQSYPLPFECSATNHESSQYKVLNLDLPLIAHKLLLSLM